MKPAEHREHDGEGDDRAAARASRVLSWSCDSVCARGGQSVGDRRRSVRDSAVGHAAPSGSSTGAPSIVASGSVTSGVSVMSAFGTAAAADRVDRRCAERRLPGAEQRAVAQPQIARRLVDHHAERGRVGREVLRRAEPGDVVVEDLLLPGELALLAASSVDSSYELCVVRIDSAICAAPIAMRAERPRRCRRASFGRRRRAGASTTRSRPARRVLRARCGCAGDGLRSLAALMRPPSLARRRAGAPASRAGCARAPRRRRVRRP